MKTLDQHLDEYKRDGYTIFPGLFGEELMSQWRQKFADIAARANHLQKGGRGWWIRSTTEYEPQLFFPAVADPTILDFAELVMGPFVQLDNLTFAAFPPVPKEDVAGKVSGWHRDIWAEVPRTGDYTRPLACNAIAYLQELTDEYGPLRVVPGSHRRPILMEQEARTRPRADEVIVHAKAGDVVFTHNGLLHSGTPNTSGKPRYFFSIYYNLSWLKHRDNHSGPNVQALVEAARKRNDRRIMRLFGVDELVFARANSGFLQPDEERWAEWIAEDRAALQPDA